MLRIFMLPCPSVGRLVRALRDRRGVSALEFALITPILILLMMGAFDFGSAYQQSIRLESAARAGAQYAFNHAKDLAKIEAYVRDNLAEPAWGDVKVTASVPLCRGATPGSTCQCGSSSTCTTANPAVVRIVAERKFEPIFPLTLSLFPSLATIRGAVDVRVY